MLDFNRSKGRKKIKIVISTLIPFAKLIPFPSVVTLNSSLGLEPVFRIDKVPTDSFCLLNFNWFLL
jgi:hypothetical protein